MDKKTMEQVRKLYEGKEVYKLINGDDVIIR